MGAADTDDDWENGGVTRQAVLEARGYDTTVINGNGHIAGDSGNVYENKAEDSPTCSQCDRPAVDGRPTCGQAPCVQSHKRMAKRARYAASRANGNGDGKPALVAQPPSDVFGRAALLLDLLPAGAQLEIRSGPVTAAFYAYR